MTRVRARYLEVQYLEMRRLEMTVGCGLPSSFTLFTFPQARPRWHGPTPGPRQLAYSSTRLPAGRRIAKRE
jgi:hypothetical protein